MRVQTWDLGEGCGKPAFATRSLEGNEKRRLFVSKNIIYFIFEINLLKKTERKRPGMNSIKEEVEFNSESEYCRRPETAF